ncbi:MAG: glycosyltransferase family 2 protein [Silvanigrellaceae bacterium]|nr:glycosyltransferase family 2 protein [Silvanigrellaceae bacterium]
MLKEINLLKTNFDKEKLNNKLTCVINVKNCEDYIEQAIISVLKQTVVVKVLIVDNYSTDSTPKILGKFPGIEVVQPPELCTLGAARNFSLLHVDSEFVAWLDADDIWEERFAELNLIAFSLSDNKISFISSAAKVIHSNGDIKKECFSWEVDNKFEEGELLEGINAQEILLKNQFRGPLCSHIFNTKSVKRVGGFKDHFAFAEDADLLLKLLKTETSLHINSALSRYRLHENQNMQRLSPKVIYGEMIQLLNENYFNLMPKEEYLKQKEILTLRMNFFHFKREKNLVNLLIFLKSILRKNSMRFVFNKFVSLVEKKNPSLHSAT